MLILVLHQNNHIRCINIIGKIWGKRLALLREATFMKAQLTTTGHCGRQSTQVKRPLWDEVLSAFDRRMRMLQSLQGNKCCAIGLRGHPVRSRHMGNMSALPPVSKGTLFTDAMTPITSVFMCFFKNRCIVIILKWNTSNTSLLHLSLI